MCRRGPAAQPGRSRNTVGNHGTKNYIGLVISPSEICSIQSQSVLDTGATSGELARQSPYLLSYQKEVLIPVCFIPVLEVGVWQRRREQYA